MGAEGYLAAAALRAIVAQRLVRRICDSCQEPHVTDARERVGLTTLGGPEFAALEFFHGSGCTHCNGTGYRGRIGVYELLELDEAMAEALRRNDQSEYARVAARQPGFQTLTHCALAYAAEGITSLTEVFRVAEELTDTPDDVALAASSEPDPQVVTPASG
jgi:MSHA biogenesis protein MshE